VSHNVSVIIIEPVALANLPAFKETRLRALEDSPSAFGSTYARESQLKDEEWETRVRSWSGEAGVGFLAFDEGIACGIAGSYLTPDDPSRAHLISMWTAPSHRHRGIGRMLVDEVSGWARRRGAAVLQLMVTSTNAGAMLYYQRLGFVRTGRTKPYPNDPALVEYEMARSLL
jgi:ribosomal protein S18 acetylase RimI-like enzyme